MKLSRNQRASFTVGAMMAVGAPSGHISVNQWVEIGRRGALPKTFLLFRLLHSYAECSSKARLAESGYMIDIQDDNRIGRQWANIGNRPDFMEFSQSGRFRGIGDMNFYL